MPLYDLHAVDDGISAHLDTFEAGDIDEAIELSVIRQERRNLEIHADGNVVACLWRDGRFVRE